MMSSKNSGFTAKDIDRYHSGNMSDQERHALEKAALDDPFLADALEGYALTPTASADLANIQSRLNERLNSTNKVIPFYTKYKWLSVAAIVLILAGAGWLTFSISKSRNDSFATAPREAKKQIQSAESKLSAPSPVDTTKTAISPSYQNGTVSTQRPSLSDPVRTNNSSLANKSQQHSHKLKEQVPAKTEAASALVDNATQSVETTNTELSNGSKNNLARNMSAEPRANNRAEAYPKTAPPAKEVATTAPALRARTPEVIATDTIRNVNIVMHPLPPDSLGMSEVVIVGYGTKKKTAANVYHPQVIVDTLEPEEGYDSFDDYIATNLNVPEEYKTKAVPGEVQLSFDVDRNGQPTNITVVKSLCQKCDEEAIRLLKEGPKWKKKKDKKGKLTITF
jgi:TonB family protein